MSAARIAKLQRLAESTSFEEERKACLEKIAKLTAELKIKQPARRRYVPKMRYKVIEMSFKDMMDELERSALK